MSRDLISTPLLRAHRELLERPGPGLTIRTHHRRAVAVEGEVAVSDAEVERRRTQILAWRLQKPHPMRLQEIATRLNISKVSVQKHIATHKAAGKLPLERKMGRR